MRDRFQARTLVVLAWALTGSIIPAEGQDESQPPTSLYDTRLGELRRATVHWDRHLGPSRKVVDQVVLVPDVPAFFEAIAEWDDGHWSPILIDDAELVPKFLRAFRPSRVVRYPARPKPFDRKNLWNAAIRAVGASWGQAQAGPVETSGSEGSIAGGAPRTRRKNGLEPTGDVVPEWLGPTPPGVVVATTDSPSLAGAVALAAGRFQPLLRWEPESKKFDVSEEQARVLSLGLETLLGETFEHYAGLGDQCDFITLAGPYPDRYRVGGAGLRAGVGSFDDFIGRDRETMRRWAFAGRLSGSPSESVYRAMCSLFLQPKTALLFDGYDETDQDFRPYSMRLAAPRMPRDLRVNVISGAKADLEGWNRVERPINEFGLVYVNSSGGLVDFNLAGRTMALSPDVPPTVPAAVVMNHSYSASSPEDSKSIAGAWLSSGAYLYFGALYEPYIQSFRTPNLVATLMTEGMPVAAALRMSPDEHRVFGMPWRLHLLGDPLFRIDPRSAKAARSAPMGDATSWLSYVEEAAPPAGSPDITKLAWAVKATILDAAKGNEGPSPANLVQAIVEIQREALPNSLRSALDGLRIEYLPRSGEQSDALLAKLAAIPPAETSPQVARAVLSARVFRFRMGTEKREWSTAARYWEEIVRSDAQNDIKTELTRRISALALQTSRLGAWGALLKDVLKDREKAPDAKMLRDELDRIQKVSGPAAPPSVRRGT